MYILQNQLCNLFVLILSVKTVFWWSHTHLQRYNNASIPTSVQATFPYIFAVSQYLQVHITQLTTVNNIELWNGLISSCTAWSIWSGGLYHLRRGGEAIPERLLQWNHRGSWIWRSSQRWVCLPYNTWNCSPPPPRSMGIQPSPASHQGKTGILFLYQIVLLTVLFLWNYSFEKFNDIYLTISSFLLYQKTKKVSKVEVGTRSTDASMDEWLEVRIFFSCSIFRVCFFFVVTEVCVCLPSGNSFGQDIVWEIKEQEELRKSAVFRDSAFSVLKEFTSFKVESWGTLGFINVTFLFFCSCIL